MRGGLRMRLAAVENPRGLVMKFFYWLSRRQLGKVITPLKVVYARNPRLLAASYPLSLGLAYCRSLEAPLPQLVTAYTAMLNGCAFCHDLGLALATRAKLGREKFDALREHRTSPVFSSREKAALAFVEEAASRRRVSDETFGTLRAVFSEREIVVVLWLHAAETYFNCLSVPLELESDGLEEIALQGQAAPPPGASMRTDC